MSSTHKFLHGILAGSSCCAALASFIISLRMGAWQFMKENFIDGLCVDVWEGFFLSPRNLIAIAFLLYLPIHCYTNHVPFTIQFLSAIMGIPSYLFFIAMFLEISPVVLPVGTMMVSFSTFGLSQYRLLVQTPKIQKEKPSVSFSPQLQLQKIQNNSNNNIQNQSFHFNNQNIPAIIVQSNSNSEKSDFIISDSTNSTNSSASRTNLSLSPKNSSFLSSMQKPNSSPTNAISKRKRRES